MKDVSHVLIIGDFNLPLITGLPGHAALTVKIYLKLLLLVVLGTYFFTNM